MAPTSTTGRTLLVVLVTAAIAAPAVVLRALCLGRSCQRPIAASAEVPFCSLPEPLRAQIEAGFRDGRSPEVLTVTADPTVRGSTALDHRGRHEAGIPAVWPSTTHPEPEEVPVIFWGNGVHPGPISGSYTLADVAPTIAEIIGLDRPHPNVRSGRPIPGVAAPADPPRLVLQIVLKGIGTDDLERNSTHRWSEVQRLMDEGAGTLSATTGSLPPDPAATLTTIGTGGLPGEHGITGTLVRNDEGELVEAWGPGAPFSVISTLGDDLDELNDDRPLIGVIGDDADRGLIGGNWYPGGDRDDVTSGGGHERDVMSIFLGPRGYGSDGMTDLLAVALPHGVAFADEVVRVLVDMATDAVGRDDLTVIVTGTGSSPGGGNPLRPPRLEDMLTEELGADLVEATAVGGFFLDQEAVAEADASRQDVVEALRRLRAPDGQPLFADAFTSLAVSLARYC
jgi:Type I phosphodiesterase / nucleotide pyrophosphatase